MSKKAKIKIAERAPLKLVPAVAPMPPFVRVTKNEKVAEQLEALFENANDAILVVDLKKKEIAAANLQALELTGYLRSEIVGDSVSKLFPTNRELPEHSQGLALTHLENSGFFEDLVLQNKDGMYRFVSLSVKVLSLGRNHVAMCIFRDVTEKKNMERELITKHGELRNAYLSLEKANAEHRAMQDTLVESGKLAALGELAAGIAHELNQPLTGVKGFAQEALATIPNEKKLESIKTCLEEVVKGAEKMERIITHLRKFTRKSTEDFEWVDVHEVIDESLVMLAKQFRSRGIEVIREYGSDVPKIYCNPFQLEQVFINLATNARDAIESKRAGRGKIVIRTLRHSSKIVEVQFEDDGTGITEAARSKIFNPFFTTKEVGKGMGLGLSITH
ncbi:MAG TPA: PAS domain S-box protein, partial [Oligoflexia bacterium]|nr:PAS domain S-box protein [Oligoflexia bacterium]